MLAAVSDLKEKGNVSIDENVDTDIGIDGRSFLLTEWYCYQCCQGKQKSN